MTQVQRFSLWLNDYAQQALIKNERRLVILSGKELWALSLIESINGILSAHKGHLDDNQPSLVVNKTSFFYGDSSVFTANVQKKRYRDKTR